MCYCEIKFGILAVSFAWRAARNMQLGAISGFRAEGSLGQEPPTLGDFAICGKTNLILDL